MNILALLIFLLAVIIVLAAIFHKNFQDKIFKNKGEASYEKFTIRGVSFLVIVLALIGGAIFTQFNDVPEYNVCNETTLTFECNLASSSS